MNKNNYKKTFKRQTLGRDLAIYISESERALKGRQLFQYKFLGK